MRNIQLPLLGRMVQAAFTSPRVSLGTLIHCLLESQIRRQIVILPHPQKQRSRKVEKRW